MSLAPQDITGEPLSAHRLFQTRDIDRARHFVAQKFCAHELKPGASHKDFDTCHNHAPGDTLSLNYLRYGSEVSINPGELDRFYLIQIPLHGAARVRNGARTVEATARTASVLNPSHETEMIWHKGCEKLLIQIDRAALHATAEALTGHNLDNAIVFDPQIDRTSAPIQTWCTSVAAAVKVANCGGAFGKVRNRHQGLLEEDLVQGFLQSQHSSISHLIENARNAPSVTQLRRAWTFMLENLAEPITMTRIAQEAGCSIRSLQCGFKQHYGYSPKQFLQQQRLGYAHYLLQTAPPDTLVSAIAYDAGFSHLGRFAIAYRKAFGQSPSETLSAQRC